VTSVAQIERLTPSPTGRLRRMTTPRRVGALSILAAVVAIVLGTVITTETLSADGGLTEIGQRSAPQMVATADLSLALDDMDSQLANILLAGDDPALAGARTGASRVYEQRRLEAGRDIQQAAAAAGNDAASQGALRSVLDGLGAYEALAAKTMLLDDEKAHPAGRPSSTVLGQYRSATDQLKSQLLPAVTSLTSANAAALQRTYQAQRSETGLVAVLTGAGGIGLVGALLALQFFLGRRFRRRINPALAVATVVAFALGLCGPVLFTAESGHLRVAKKSAFDSILALSQARAVSYDANADESRYLADPVRAGQYQLGFLDRSQRLADLPGATIGTYDASLAGAVGGYRADHTDLAFGGLFGTGFRNITFTGERAAAERTLAAYQTYERDDRTIRALANAGNLRGSIAFDTGYAAGQSNGDFGAYDNALAGWIKINQNGFTGAVDAGHDDLTGWTVIPLVAMLAIIGLVLVGIRPRLAEYQ
jgi:hypothetical protein